MKKNKWVGVWIGLLGLMLFAFLILNQRVSKDQNVPVSEFVDRVENGEFVKVTITGEHARGETANGTGVTTYVSEKEPLVRALHDKHVKYEEREPSNSGSWLQLLFKFGLPLVLMDIFFRGMQKAGPGNLLKQQTTNKAKMQPDTKTMFTDVAGIDEAVEECRDFVTFLKDPPRFATLGARIPKGVLLIGPPGTGKTLLARAIAGEADVPFLAGNGAEFVEVFVGVGAARVRDLFEKARKSKPCIVFIDELDAVGKKRNGVGGIGSHTEMEQTLNQLLVEMDGFSPNEGIIVIAATNRPETLDDALLRSGRFDRTVTVDPPDVRGREAILKVHARNKTVAPDVDYSTIARGTSGLVGADLEKLLNEAALDAAKRGKKAITTEDIERAKEKVYMGPERKSAVLSEQTKHVIAYHEAGHALVGWFTPEANPPHRVTIIPRGRALGLTWFLPPDDLSLCTRNQLLAQIKVGLGGRAAEKVILSDNFTTGASNDLMNATMIVRRMVEEFGMGDNKLLGPGTFGKKEGGSMFDQGKDYGEDTASKIDAEKRRILTECEAKADALVLEKRSLLDALAKALRVEETIGHDRLLAILGQRKVAL